MNNIETVIDSTSKKVVFKSYISFSENDFKNEDLSMLDIKAENYFEIQNSNLENTGLKIKLTKTAKFTNCNLIGCPFVIDKYLLKPKTNKDNYLDFKNTYLDAIQIEQLNSIYDKNYIYYDLKTILNNNGLFISSTKLFELIRNYLLSSDTAFPHILTEEKIQRYKDFIELVISKDIEGHLKKIYETLKPQMTDYEIVSMFRDKPIEHKVIKDMTIVDKDYEILKNIWLRECELQNITFDVQEDNLFKYYNNSQNYIKVDNIFMPHIKKVSNENMPKRITNSPFTFRRNLYVELGRTCNGKCEFCRNQYFHEKEYCFSNIIKNLRNKMYDFNSIVIGGGEPT